MEVERQIRIQGKVKKTSRAESEEYFHSRPIGAQLGAWASHQSETIDARGVLAARHEEMKQRFGEGPIRLPPHWDGLSFRVCWRGRAVAIRIAGTSVQARLVEGEGMEMRIAATTVKLATGATVDVSRPRRSLFSPNPG